MNMNIYTYLLAQIVGGALASWLVRSFPDQAVRVRAPAGDIVLCSLARHFTLTVPFSTQVHLRVKQVVRKLGKLLFSGYFP